MKPGESFWSIAASVAETRLGHAPTSSEVDPVWRALIAANQDQLPNPHNPSLLFVGMTLVVPP